MVVLTKKDSLQKADKAVGEKRKNSREVNVDESEQEDEEDDEEEHKEVGVDVVH